MTRSDTDRQPEHAGRILGFLRHHLADSTLTALIDDPIDLAVRAFQAPDRPVASQGDFLDLAAGFLGHVCSTAFPAGQQLSPLQARAEAIGVFEQGFPGGFRGALWEAKHPLGLEPVGIVEELTALLKTRLRKVHAQWIFACVLGDLDWQMRCQLAGLILKGWGDRRPPELLAASSEQYADHLALLVQYDLEYRPYQPGASSAASR